MMITLRDYQEKLVADIREKMAMNRRVLAVSPTGSGKTTVFSYISAGAIRKNKRVVIAVHRAEILDQISESLRAFDVPHGRIQPGFMPSLHNCQIGMIQTISRRLSKLFVPDLLITDECHHATSETYVAVTEAWKTARSLGVTATPERLDGRGLGAQYDCMVLGPQTHELIARKFLADFRYLAPEIGADMSGIKTVAGDYDRGALAYAMDRPTITGSAIGHYRDYLHGAPTIAFCVSIAHAEHVAEQFRDAGYRAASIDGKMNSVERKLRLNGLADGSLQVLTSCDLIGEGVDVPAVRGAIMLRRSKSLSLVLQQAGRALRLKKDGGIAVILDHVGNAELHGTPRTHRDWVLTHDKKKNSAPSIRQCKRCYRVVEPKEAFDCDDRGEKGCLLSASGAIIDRTPVEKSGSLVEISDSPAWASGIRISSASGYEYKAMLHLAKTREQLKEIARIRKYHYKWVDRILAERAAIAESP